VDERKYNFRKLLHGLIQHDIYHLGQIAYIKKIASSNSYKEGTKVHRPLFSALLRLQEKKIN
jgi:hypothetical protein